MPLIGCIPLYDPKVEHWNQCAKTCKGDIIPEVDDLWAFKAIEEGYRHPFNRAVSRVAFTQAKRESPFHPARNKPQPLGKPSRKPWQSLYGP